MALKLRKNELMSFGKTNENKVFTYHEIRLKKTVTEKMLDITIHAYLTSTNI